MGWLRPQAEEALLKAAMYGELATLTRLVEEGVNVNAADVRAAPPARPQPPPPSPPAAPCCPALAAAADRVWRRRRASAARHDGPHVGG